MQNERLLLSRNPAAAAQLGCRRLASKDLFGGARRLEIEHRGEIYRLQITRQGKLILTK